MLNIFWLLILSVVVYAVYYLIIFLKDIRDLLEVQRDQNEQIIDLLEQQNPDRNQW
ncbi:hypothetical protein [Pseudalkalibacillus salsuginis]|uniref:hypothetical protein n=1 Tax=Pseudalkalibacillus salsuginis TaxID=2910972 RepID=UPI001F1ECDDF|nr:hypothetical protein [Pseudalkalibacillus salsuginis]MCF6411301.1 hypothetical protein [Pseudalkalibacillus salsuginis]